MSTSPITQLFNQIDLPATLAHLSYEFNQLDRETKTVIGLALAVNTLSAGILSLAQLQIGLLSTALATASVLPEIITGGLAFTTSVGLGAIQAFGIAFVSGASALASGTFMCIAVDNDSGLLRDIFEPLLDLVN